MAQVAGQLRDRVKQCSHDGWKCGCLERIDVYGMGVTYVQYKDNTGGYNKNIQVTAETKLKVARQIQTMFTRYVGQMDIRQSYLMVTID